MSRINNRSLALIPCYNEELTIGSIILECKKYVDSVLVIDDGSTDNTAEIAKGAGAIVISHKQNKGKSEGIKTGFKFAMKNNFDYVITLDGDAQHDPREIPVLLQSVQNNGHDITIGVRFGETTEMPFYRKIGKRVLDCATSFANGGYITDSQCGFRAFNKKAITNLIPRINGNSFTVESEQLIKAHEAGLQVSSTKVSCRYKNLETSTKKPTTHGFSVLAYVLNLVVTKKPIIIASVPGFLLVLFALFLGLLNLQYFLQTNLLNIASALSVVILFVVGFYVILTVPLIKIFPLVLKQALQEK